MSFDRYAYDYEQQVQAALSSCRADHATILAAKAEHLLATIDRMSIASSRPPLILDVGCGIGSLERYLAGGGRRLIGVDPAIVPLLRAGREADALGFAAFDGQRLPFADGSFDVVFAASVFHHVPPSGRGTLLAELTRVTRAGGLVAVLEHNPWNPLTRRIVSRCEFDRDAVLLTAGETCQLLRNAGLDRIDHRFTLFTPWSGRWWHRIETLLGRVPLGGQYIAFGVRAPRR